MKTQFKPTRNPVKKILRVYLDFFWSIVTKLAYWIESP